TASPSSPTARQAVTFDAGGSSTSDSDTIETYTWNFGDGTQQTTNSPTTQHTFKSAGAPTVTLTITDAGSATSSPTSHALTIKAAPQSPPTARFKFSPAHPVASQAVRFDASRSSDTDGDSITSYRWTFGDGTKLT